MASSLFLLLDDIATALDDVAVLTKVATKKTAGVLGDDLALNAEQVSGVRAERELPVVWAVFKGSMRNKAILVPAALLISAIFPPLVTLLLMFGGAYLCYEGVEKVVHTFFHKELKEQNHKKITQALLQPKADMVALEQEKISGAIRTDFILSAEIIVITLGTVAASDLLTKSLVLSAIAIGITIGVYGLVAGIVKLDDLGLYLSKRASSITQTIGRGILIAAPILMKGLSIVGTLAMFLVGGGILAHGWHSLGHAIEGLASQANQLPAIGNIVSAVTPMLANAVFGFICGAVLLGIITLVQGMRGKNQSH